MQYNFYTIRATFFERASGNLDTQNASTKKHFCIDSENFASTMTTLSLIKEAIVALKDRSGSSVIAINKFLETEKQVR
jgi:linker histone H1 and H5 family